MNHDQSKHRRFAICSWGIGQVAALGAIGLSVSAPFALATDNWTAGSDNWTVPGDWSAGVPGSGADASIAESDGVSRTINYDYSGPAVALNSFSIDLTGGTGAATNALSIQANDLTVTTDEQIGVIGSGTVTQMAGINTINGSAILGSQKGSTGVYNLSGTGTVTGNGNIVVGGGVSGTGTMNQSGGTVSMTNTGIGETLVLGGEAASNGSGTYDLSGGSLTSYSEDIGARGAGTFTQTGGTNTVSSTSLQYVALAVGSRGANPGTYTLSGTGTLSSISETIYPTGTFTQNGGTNTITGLSQQGAAFAIESGTAPGGAYNLNGGTLNADLLTNEGIFTQTGGHATFSQVDGNRFTLTGGVMTLSCDGFSGPASTMQYFDVGGTGILNLELAGYTQGVNYDSLTSGEAISLGGTLDIDLADGFVPKVGDQFTVMSGPITGAFSQLISDDPGLTYSVNYGPSDNMVQLTIASVPEPSSLSLLGLGGLRLLARRQTKVAV
jgi:hypothetical protein